jgi:hypothetical protein
MKPWQRRAMSESTDPGIVQVREVAPATLAVLRERARSLGQSLSGYLRDLMDVLAARQGAAVTLTYVVDCSLVIDALSARKEDEVLR